MKATEIQKERNMSYFELCEYLKNKYGKVKEDYFLDSQCIHVNKGIKRSAEGLEIHHIKEALPNVFDLSKSIQASNYPFEYQKSYNLCYCNLLEHLILHILINIERSSNLEQAVIDGTFIIMNRLDDLYEISTSLSKLQENMLSPIKNNYTEYVEITNQWFDTMQHLLNS